ncbi:hypothetical protein FRC14_000424 [Serendipita sp. 396]|nr:hypothetical protein FRC14_000424 [Serendipita sp. 396]
MEQHYDPPPFQIPVPGTQPTANLTSPTEAYQMQQRTPTHPYPNHPSNGGYSHTSFQQDQRPTANGGGEVIQSPQNGGYFQFDSETAIERVEVAPQPVSQPGQEPRRERTLRRELNSYQAPSAQDCWSRPEQLSMRVVHSVYLSRFFLLASYGASSPTFRAD